MPVSAFIVTRHGARLPLTLLARLERGTCVGIVDAPRSDRSPPSPKPTVSFPCSVFEASCCPVRSADIHSCIVDRTGALVFDSQVPSGRGSSGTPKLSAVAPHCVHRRHGQATNDQGSTFFKKMKTTAQYCEHCDHAQPYYCNNAYQNVLEKQRIKEDGQ